MRFSESLGFVAVLGLTACQQTTPVPSGPVVANAAQEFACRDAVSEQTGDADPAIVSTTGEGDSRTIVLTSASATGSWRCRVTLAGDVTELTFSPS